MDNIYVNYLLTALILTFAIPGAGVVIEQFVKLLYSVTAAFLGDSFTYFIFNRLTFIGVFHHELSHALLATVTGAKVTKIVFFHPDGDRLGYVEYVTRGNIIMRSIQQALASITGILRCIDKCGYLLLSYCLWCGISGMADCTFVVCIYFNHITYDYEQTGL